MLELVTGLRMQLHYHLFNMSHACFAVIISGINTLCLPLYVFNIGKVLCLKNLIINNFQVKTLDTVSELKFGLIL